MAHAPRWDALLSCAVHFGRGKGNPWEDEPIRESGVATTVSATLTTME